MEFVRLSDIPDMVEAVARFHAELTGDDSDDGLAMRKAAFQKLALDGEEEDVVLGFSVNQEGAGEILGMAVLVKTEMEAFDDLSPWVTGILVEDGPDKCDLTADLVHQIEIIATQIGHGQIFAHTAETSFWKKQGFAEIEPFEKDGVEHWVVGKAL